MKRLKIKFVLLASLSLFLLLTIIVAGMNIINYLSLVHDADEVLVLLSRNEGRFPERAPDEQPEPLPPNMSPELPYESRFFSVVLAPDGALLHTETSRIAAVNEEQAAEYAKTVWKSGKTRGFTDRFRFLRSDEQGEVRITFLDRGRQLDVFWNFLLAGIMIALCGFAAVFLIIFFCAGRIIRPIAQSYEKQKRFITDAGHEIKTPLTVINANVDILEMELGEQEGLSEIRRQSARLADLTRDLVYLARMEETERPQSRVEFPLSEVVEGAATPFIKPAQLQDKELSLGIAPLLSMTGDAKAIEQLVGLLLDNALKYSPDGGHIELTLDRHGRTMLLQVCNDASEPVSAELLSHAFDRFWRADPSRNSATGGHGIGLSLAKAIVTAHGGRIEASMQDGHRFAITALFPV